MLLSPGERRMVKVSPILSIAKQNTVSGHSEPYRERRRANDVS